MEMEEAHKLRDSDQLFASLDTHQTEIIITFTSPELKSFKSVDWSSDKSKAAYQKQINSLQNKIILNSGAIPKIKYNIAPAMSLYADMNTIEKLLKDPRVLTIEPNQELEPQLAQGLALINGNAIRSQYDGSGTTIAIIDSGIDYNHKAFGDGGFPNDKVIMGTDIHDDDTDPMDFNGHGSAVAGIAAGDVTVNSPTDYIGGVAPGAKLAAVKVFGDDEFVTKEDIVGEGILWCVENKYFDKQNPIVVANVSIGAEKFTSIESCETTHPFFALAGQIATNAGILLPTAAGNSGYCDALGRPACVSSFFAIGATFDASLGLYSTNNLPSACLASDIAVERTPRKVTPYSNSATFLDMFAPSHLTTTPYVGFEYVSNFEGTSAAAPYVSGSAAILQSISKQSYGDFQTLESLRANLLNSDIMVTDFKTLDQQNVITKPFLNLEQSIQNVLETRPDLMETSDDHWMIF